MRERMLDLQGCVGCRWLHDAARPECRFKGWCSFQYSGKPSGYRTPEDGMRREVRDAGDGRTSQWTS